MPLFEEKVAEGFKAAGERMNTIESGVKETQAALKALMNQIKLLSGAFRSGELTDGRPYKAFWPSEEHAKAFGELILSVLGRKGMAEGTASSGGVLMPTELSDRIIQKLGQYGKYRGNTTIVPIGSGKAIVPKVESDLTVYCPGQGNEIDASDMGFSQVTLVPETLCCLAKVSNELVEDAIIAIGEILGISITRSMAKKEDEIGFSGDGTEAYFGMLGIIGALLKVDATIANIKGIQVGSGNTWAELILQDFEDTAGILPSDADDGAAWYCTKKFFHKVMRKLLQGGAIPDVSSILTRERLRYFLGYPVNFVSPSCMPVTEANNQICAILGDLQLGSFLGERRILTIEQSRDVYFANNQVGVRGTERIDINAYGVGDTSEAGAIVALATAGS